MADKRKESSHPRPTKAERMKETTRKVYYDEAMAHLKAADYITAMTAFNKALELNEADKKALVARSKCHLLSGQPAQALRDAQAALDIDKSFAKGLYQKAEALYHLGEFEQSLMYHHRGLSIRPQMKGFKLGVQKAQEAIENVIGNNKCPFPDSPEMLKKLLDAFNNSNGNKTESASNATSTATNKNKNPMRASTSSRYNKTKKAERQLLGSLYKDKQYLEQLLENAEVITLNQEFVNNDVAEHAKEGIEFLKSRQEFWRQRKPAHNRTFRR